jgi:hypothetical protein
MKIETKIKIASFCISHLIGLWLCVAVLFGISGFFIGCTTSQQTAAYNTLSGLETGTTAAYNAYLTLVVQGKVTTNAVPQVSHAYNDFQAAMVIATVSAQNNTNALAPTNLVTEAAAVVNLITTIEGGH